MKLNIKLIYISIAVLSAACTKDLTETPKSSISPDEFFQTVTQCTEAVNGVYTSLIAQFGQEDLWQVTESGQDLTCVSKINQPNINFQYTFARANSSNSDNMWAKCYTNIKNANLVISRVAAANIDTAMRSRLVGETKFLRALNYYILSNIFGGVPLWTDELDVNKVSTLPRASLADVRAQIISDLTDAAASLPLSYTATDVGRATKGAALALLAKVYLFQQDWKDAQTAALRVENSGTYTLMQNYANLFDVNNGYKNNSESIFEIQYRRDPVANINYQTNYYCTWYVPIEDGNGKTYAGVNFGTTVLRGFEVYYPSAKMVSLFEPNDLRMPVVLGYGYNGTTFTRFPAANNRPWFGPKFWDLQSSVQSSGKDLYFLRYADVILTLAEAYNEGGNTSGGITEVDKIRQRAGLQPLDPSLSQDSVRTLIMNERAIEFVGEFQRKWDLVRWGKLVPYIQAMQQDDSAGAVNIKPYQTYYPIPDNEVIKNPNLIQTPGY